MCVCRTVSIYLLHSWKLFRHLSSSSSSSSTSTSSTSTKSSFITNRSRSIVTKHPPLTLLLSSRCFRAYATRYCLSSLRLHSFSMVFQVAFNSAVAHFYIYLQLGELFASNSQARIKANQLQVNLHPQAGRNLHLTCTSCPQVEVFHKWGSGSAPSSPAAGVAAAAPLPASPSLPALDNSSSEVAFRLQEGETLVMEGADAAGRRGGSRKGRKSEFSGATSAKDSR